MPPVGIEPTTTILEIAAATTELRGRHLYYSKGNLQVKQFCSNLYLSLLFFYFQTPVFLLHTIGVDIKC